MARRTTAKAAPPGAARSRAARGGAAAPDDAVENAATAAIRDAIRAYVPDAIRELARLAREASSEQARVSAINALIDRGYGNLKSATDGDDRHHGITVRFAAPDARPARADAPGRKGPG